MPSFVKSAERQHPRARRLLAAVAQREAALERAGNAQMAGEAIEPYLATLREALNQNCRSTEYSDLAKGYHWCCAFVYYCCLQAGFRFPPKPVPSYRYTLAAVPAWHHWAQAEGFFLPAGSSSPEHGDIVLYNNVACGQPLDHIGIVVEVIPEGILSAEGNNDNRAGIFPRISSAAEGYVRLPENLQLFKDAQRV